MATRNTLHVNVVTAEQELYNGEADYIQVQGSDGQLGILPEHAAMLAELGTGALVVRFQGEEEHIFISGGFLEVSNDTVAILADTAEHAEDIDASRAEEARRRAQERLEQSTSNRERAEAQAALLRALSRLRIIEGIQTRPHRRRSTLPSE